jgi:cytochrome c553
MIAAVAVLALTGLSSADDLVMAPEKFSHCVTCHGVELAGNRSVASPNLSVLQPWYVERQLLAFADRGRGNSNDEHGMEMQPQAAALDERLLTEAVDFVASVPARSAVATIAGDMAAGETLYATCSACHGMAGEGNQLFDAPALTGQSDWYMLRQLQNYRAGIRGSAPGDVAGAQMKAAAGVLQTGNNIRDVVAYINSLATH